MDMLIRILLVLVVFSALLVFLRFVGKRMEWSDRQRELWLHRDPDPRVYRVGSQYDFERSNKA